MKKDKGTGSQNLRLAALFCLVAIGFIALGVSYYRYEAQRIKDYKYDEIAAIAKLKADSIQEWREHRLADVQSVSIGPLVRREIARLLQDPTNPSARAALHIQLKINRKVAVYADALFLDTKGNILLSDNPKPAPVDQATMKAIEFALKDRKEFLSDFFRDPDGNIWIDAVAPIPDLDNTGRLIAVVVLRSKATDFLYPFIQSWPTPSKTAETLLVCRDGDSILFLNELRHRSKTALTLRFPLADTQLPGVQAVLGNYGRLHGRDYRGVEVLAVTQPVPESSWSIVAKVDEKEIMSEVKYRAGVVSIIVFLLILISAGLIMQVYRNRQEVDRRKAEEVLKESEERFRTIFDKASDGILIADAVTKIFAQGNVTICSMLGYTQEEIKSLGIHDIHPPDDLSHVLDEFEKQVKGEKVLTEDLPVLRKDGAIFYADISSTLLIIGGRHYLACIFRDITERKQAEEALRVLSSRQEAILAAVPEIIMEVDNNKIYTWANSVGIEFFGADVIGKEAAFYFEGEQDTYDTVKPLFCGAEDIIYVESWQRRRDGEKRLLAWWCRVLKDESGQATGALSSASDITERKQAEEEIRKLNLELEQRVMDRTTQLEAANKELDAFSYSVSHDLRGPLRAIDGFSRILLEDYRDKLDAEGNRLLNIIRTNTKQMDQLITELLDLSRVSKSELKFSRIDMTTMAHSIYHEIASPEVRENFVFTVAPLPDGNGDSTLLRQVWSNLLSNAVKFTMPRDERRIEITGYTEKDMNIYSIRDTGVGFNPDYIPKLFGVFQRLHKSSEFEGIGVGLAIVQRIVHRHGGRVWAEGKINEGATFSFSLPLKGGNS